MNKLFWVFFLCYCCGILVVALPMPLSWLLSIIFGVGFSMLSSSDYIRKP